MKNERVNGCHSQAAPGIQTSNGPRICFGAWLLEFLWSLDGGAWSFPFPFPASYIRVMFPTQNLHVKETVRLLTPGALKAELPMSEASNQTVVASRQRVTRILQQ